jgi:hypothetical protein
MSRIFRGTALACYMGLVLFSAGCAEDNEKTADLKSTPAPSDGKTEQDRLNQMKNAAAGGGMAKEGYPGAKKK